MSDYKLVNGKKVRVCKYNCGTELLWSDEISGFIEKNGGVPHTKERCEGLKKGHNNGYELSLELVLKKLEKIGITINMEKLRGVQI
jgi:hypothetical protein